MKDEELSKTINNICVFKNPNNFTDYHKNIFKKNNEVTKNYFYVSQRNIDLYFNNKGQFLEDKIGNFIQQNQNKIINKGKKNIKKYKNHKRERDYIVLVEDDDNGIVEDKNNFKLFERESLKLIVCPICFADIKNLPNNKKLIHLKQCQK